MVSELIDDDLSCWNKDKLEENFVLVDVEAICAIPISRFGEDEWAWAPEKTSYFSVRSAYKLLAADRRHSENSLASGASAPGFWK